MAKTKKAESEGTLIRELLERELGEVEHALKRGPGGLGWRGNESKRPALEARHKLITATIKNLD